MKNLFPGYYRPTEDEFAELWENCIFVPDANILLNFYRTSPDAKETLIGIFKQISDRLWITHQAAFEYQKNRLGVISKQLAAYRDVQDYLDTESSVISRKLAEYRKHAFLDADSLNARIDRLFKAIRKDIEKQQKTHPDWLGTDSIHGELTQLFDGKVGAPYADEQLQAIYKEADQRISLKLPPGYRDDKKEGVNKYGDILIWRQILDYAKTAKKPIIFITDDTKDDWWLKHEGRTISPRPELIEEMRKEFEVAFYMYKSDQFVVWAQKYLNRTDKQEVVDELRELREIDEAENFSSEIFHKVAESMLSDNQPTAASAIRRLVEEANHPARSMLDVDTIRRFEEASHQTRLGEATLRLLEEASRPARTLIDEATLRLLEEARRPARTLVNKAALRAVEEASHPITKAGLTAAESARETPVLRAPRGKNENAAASPSNVTSHDNISADDGHQTTLDTDFQDAE